MSIFETQCKHGIYHLENIKNNDGAK